MKYLARFFLPALLAAGMSAGPAAAAAGDYILYVGSYTDAPSTSKGIYAWRFSTKDGSLKPIGLVAETVNPAYVAASPNQRYLYAVNWQTAHSKAGDTVSSFTINRKTGALTPLNVADSGGGLPNEVAIDPTGKIAVVSNYGARGLTVETNNSAFSALKIESDGKLGQPFFVEHYPGMGFKTSQDGPGAHTHGVIFSKDNKYVFVAELGIDRVYTYRIDAAKGTVKPADPAYISFDGGSGPRREALSPDGKFLYLLRQNDAKVSVLSIDNGKLTEIQKIATVPADNTARDSTAEIRITKNGDFLYASNRGPDSMAAYKVNPDGTLTSLEFIPSLGKSPRNIEIDPSGKYFFASNQNSNNVVIFKIDPKTGHLSPRPGSNWRRPSPPACFS